MKVTVTGRQFDITPAIREYVETRFQALESDRALDFTSANVVINYQLKRFDTTVVVNCKNHVVSAEASDYDLYKAFDECIDKVDSQLRTIREKVRDHQAPPLREVTKGETPAE